MTPSTAKSAGKETLARNPPSAGPMLMPRLIARRLSAIAERLFSGGTSAATALSDAGRKSSFAPAQSPVIARTARRERASGYARRSAPVAKREPRRTASGPIRSARRPPNGEEAIAHAP